MIIFLDSCRKSKAKCVAQRIGYLERSSYEEAMLSASWAKAEQLMQLLNVSWSQAIRIVNLASNSRGRKLSSLQQMLEDFSDAGVGGFAGGVSRLPASRL
jgi:hypothetical protein